MSEDRVSTACRLHNALAQLFCAVLQDAQSEKNKYTLRLLIK